MRIHQRSLSLPAPQPADDSLFVPSLPLLTDIDIVLDDLDPSLFPGVSSSLKLVCSAAKDVLAAVNTAVAKFGTKTITTVGHSLGKLSAAL